MVLSINETLERVKKRLEPRAKRGKKGVLKRAKKRMG